MSSKAKKELFAIPLTILITGAFPYLSLYPFSKEDPFSKMLAILIIALVYFGLGFLFEHLRKSSAE